MKPHLNLSRNLVAILLTCYLLIASTLPFLFSRRLAAGVAH